MSIVLIGLYFVGGFLSVRYVWNEDVMARIAGKNYVEQNLIPLMGLYLLGEAITFVAWPLVVPAISIWRWANK